MNKLKVIVLTLLVGLCFSCKDEELTQVQEAQNLDQMFSEITILAASVACDDSSEWKTTSYGSKACGGPIGYIAYSQAIDTALFLEKVEAHRTAQEEFNRRWEIISDCALAAPPNGVVCEDGKPVLN